MTTATVDAPATTEIALIDLSSIAYPIFLTSASEPDPDHASVQIVARIRALTAQHPKAAICCDEGRSFRRDINPTYKAQREAAPAALHHQIKLAKERLAADGYPVWSVKGFEADDLIATATTIALGMADVSVLVISADKDLTQLVGPRVRTLSPATGAIYDEAAVVARYKVKPSQMRDFLTLVGDASDNVKGATGVGPVTAAKLLNEYGSIDGVYAALDAHGTRFRPALATTLREFQPRMAETRTLIALRSDVEIPFAEIDNSRVSADLHGEDEMATETVDVVSGDAPAQTVTAPEVKTPEVVREVNGNTIAPQAQAVAVREPDALAPPPAEYERQLEPRSMGQASQLAKYMHEAKMFNGYGSAQAVLSTILAGRELGLQAIASLRGFHIIEGKHALAADAMRGLVLRSGQAKYFRVVERTAEVATFETLRHGEPEPVRLSYTVQEGRAAFGIYDGMPEEARKAREKSWAASGWGKHTPDMLAARASSKLARLVYADILFGLYSPEELRD
jgi:5'-3' exonuclease